MTAVNAEREVESLRRRIAGLVAVRQELRQQGASRRELERNRTRIAEDRNALAVALIALYGGEQASRNGLV